MSSIETKSGAKSMKGIMFERLAATIIAIFLIFACDDAPTKFTNDPGLFISERQHINSLEGGACWEINSTKDGTLYTTTVAGLFRSVDAGKSWSKIENTPPLRTLHMLANGHIVGSNYKASFLSRDGGNSWELIANDDFPGGEIVDIVEHPVGFLVIATDKGIFSAVAIDAKWHQIETPMNIFDLHIDQEGNVLMAGNSRVLRYFPKEGTLDTLLETGMNYWSIATDDAGNIYAGASTSDTSPTSNVLYISRDNAETCPEVLNTSYFRPQALGQLATAPAGPF